LGDDGATSDESEIDMMYGHNVSKKGERAYVPVTWKPLHFSSNSTRHASEGQEADIKSNYLIPFG
jgi:hypothetical protein